MNCARRPGLVTISFRELSPDEIVDLVAESGLQGIEWGGDVHVPHGDLETALRVGELTGAAGLKVASYGSYYRFDECGGDSESDGPSMESVLKTAVALGAPAIRVWAGRAGPNEISREVRESIVRRAQEFGEKASFLGIRLDFEYHENTLTETPESTLGLLESVNCSNVRSLWQPPLQMLPQLRLEGLRQIKPWMSNVHCNYFDQEPWPDIKPLNDGEMEWAPYLEELADSADERWVLIEHVCDHSVEQFKSDAIALKKWLSAY